MSETKPKEMTDTQLCGLLSNPFGIDDAPKTRDVREELLRRLDEADALRKEIDALRKEIDALRKDKERIDFLDDGNYGIDPRNIPGVMMNGRRFHCLAGRGDWSSLRDAIDAARLAKESEASHE